MRMVPSMFAMTLILVVGNTVVAQSSNVELPADINPVTRNRLAPLERTRLDAEGQRAYDSRSLDGVLLPRGTRNATVYSPIVAEGFAVLERLDTEGVLTPAQAQLANTPQ